MGCHDLLQYIYIINYLSIHTYYRRNIAKLELGKYRKIITKIYHLLIIAHIFLILSKLYEYKASQKEECFLIFLATLPLGQAGATKDLSSMEKRRQLLVVCVSVCVCVCVCLGWRYRAETWVRYQVFRVEADSVISFLLCLNVSMFEHDPHWPRARYKRCGPVHLPPARTKVGWWCSADSSKENV